MNTPERRQYVRDEQLTVGRSIKLMRKFIKAFFDKQDHTFQSVNWLRYYMGNLNLDYKCGLPIKPTDWKNNNLDNINKLFLQGFINELEQDTLTDAVLFLHRLFTTYPFTTCYYWILSKIKKES